MKKILSDLKGGLKVAVLSAGLALGACSDKIKSQETRENVTCVKEKASAILLQPKKELEIKVKGLSEAFEYYKENICENFREQNKEKYVSIPDDKLKLVDYFYPYINEESDSLTKMEELHLRDLDKVRLLGADKVKEFYKDRTEKSDFVEEFLSKNAEFIWKEHYKELEKIIFENIDKPLPEFKEAVEELALG